MSILFTWWFRRCMVAFVLSNEWLVNVFIPMSLIHWVQDTDWDRSLKLLQCTSFNPLSGFTLWQGKVLLHYLWPWPSLWLIIVVAGTVWMCNDCALAGITANAGPIDGLWSLSLHLLISLCVLRARQKMKPCSSLLKASVVTFDGNQPSFSWQRL